MSRNNRKTTNQKDDESSNITKKKNPTAADIYDQEFPSLAASASISTNNRSTNRFRVNNFKFLLDYIIYFLRTNLPRQTRIKNRMKQQGHFHVSHSY